MRVARVAFWLLAVLPGFGVRAQGPGGYSLGDEVKPFRLPTVADRPVSLDAYRTQKGLIVVFMSNHCPFSKAYEDRLIALDRRYAGLGFPVLAIMPNDPAAYEDDSFENMKARARDKNFPFSYAYDQTQAVARQFGATRTPQVFVLKQKAGTFTLEYTGTLDDSPQDAAGAQRRYVEEAVNHLLAGRPVATPITKPIGCAIKWKSS